MSIDTSRFHAVFFDESFEGLDALEAGLLSLDAGDRDPETLNAIFRAAHSIKGGAGTFGFQDIASVTHVLETLLDQLRSGKRDLSSELVTALLQSVDGLRQLLSAARDHVAADPALVEGLRTEFTRWLDSPEKTPAALVAPIAEKAVAVEVSAWRIRFAPAVYLFKTGNDPLRILAELSRLGPMTADVDAGKLPALEDCGVDDCYLAWTIKLQGVTDRRSIEDVFSWIDGDCELTIAPLADAEPAPAPAPAVQTPEPVTAAPAPVPPTPAAAEVKPAASANRDRNADGGSIRVDVSKVDTLINLVGELVITQAMLEQLSSHLDPVLYEKLLGGLTQLERNTRDLQEAVMAVRMLPVDFMFSRFPRVVRDLAGKLGKKVRLRTVGESTELDKGVIEKITDPLNHLVRNSLDHGLETPAERAAAGKDETGTITLEAAHQGGHIVLRVSDDGRGLDRERILKKAIERGIPIAPDAPDAEVWQLIFAPGFSTAAAVTDVSGRGVGMDVVRKNILALNGQVDISTVPGRGTTVTIRLPLTLAILDGMSVAIGGEIFIMPLNSVVESLQPRLDDIKSVSGKGRVIRVRNEFVPLVTLHEVFAAQDSASVQSRIVVILEADGRKLAVEVDELVGQQQVVIKNLESNYRRVSGISGATILGDGRVALIVDVGGLTRTFAKAA